MTTMTKNKPLKNLFDLDSRLQKVWAGPTVVGKDDEETKSNLRKLKEFGVRHIVDLAFDKEEKPYDKMLDKDTTYDCLTIVEYWKPLEEYQYLQIAISIFTTLRRIEELSRFEGYTYVHGDNTMGRVLMLSACRLGMKAEHPSTEEGIRRLKDCMKDIEDADKLISEITDDHYKMMNAFFQILEEKNESYDGFIADNIRGCMMGGAIGDALGYNVTQHGMALVSSNTQMALFTANGILESETYAEMQSIQVTPTHCYFGAYIDWYHTQTGKNDSSHPPYGHITWLRDLPRMATKRNPSETCLTACEDFLRNEVVENSSKDCAALTRIAPLGLWFASLTKSQQNTYSMVEMAESAAWISEATHRNPLAILPAIMLSQLIYELALRDEDGSSNYLEDIIGDTIVVLNDIYPGQYLEEKKHLSELTRKALKLRHTKRSESECISELGNCWNADSAWAIAVYCTSKYYFDTQAAIKCAVDNGNAATGCITGYIMGAMHGCKRLKELNLFCPIGKDIENWYELSDIILALAEDIYNGCPIDKFTSADTPDKKQWEDRYCKHLPTGIKTSSKNTIKDRVLGSLHALGFKVTEDFKDTYSFNYEDMHLLYIYDDNHKNVLSLAIPAIFICAEDNTETTNLLTTILNNTLKGLKVYKVKGELWVFYEQVVSGDEDFTELLQHSILHLEESIHGVAKLLRKANQGKLTSEDIATQYETKVYNHLFY